MRKLSSRRGFVLVIMILGLMFFVSTVGLGVDAGVVYVVRTRLQAAVDASALAAARALNTSTDPNTQESTAVTTGKAFFKANFPPGMFGTTGSDTTMTMAYGTGTAANTFYLTSNGKTTAPTYFMRVFGTASVPVTAKASAARRDINVILVLDRSSSMNTTQAGAGQTACAFMKTAAKSFVDMFSNGRDTLGLVSFNIGSVTNFAPSTNFASGMKTAIDAMSCSGDTNTANGLNRAYSLLQTLNNTGKLNVIVLFTDGQAEAITADFPVKMLPDQRYGDRAKTSGYAYTSHTTLYNMPASPCKDAAGRSYGTAGWNPFKVGDPGAGATNNTIRGSMAENDSWGPSAQGYTSGPFTWNTSSQSLTGPTTSNCAYRTVGGSYPGWAFRQDIAYIPATDLFGNLTTGYRTDYDFTTETIIPGIDKFPAGHPYAGKLRPDSPRVLFNAGFNTTDDQGKTIRADTTLNPMICTIGLGGNSGLPADAELLIRLANVQSGVDQSGAVVTNTSYNAARAKGNYVYAPDVKQLAASFLKVASFVAELAY